MPIDSQRLDLLFNYLIEPAPYTEGIKYAGSKQRLLEYILAIAKQVNPKRVLDGFSGSTRVSQAFARYGYEVVANDRSVWSEVIATCYLMNQQPTSYYRPIIEHLNNLPPEDGWFTENYGGECRDGFSVGDDGFKKPWQKHNTRKLDAIRGEIDKLGLPFTEQCVLLTSVLYALNEVDSTLGHYASYLNKWSKRSYDPMILKVPNLIERSAEHRVHRRDIFETLSEEEVDFAYFDPPYGTDNQKMPTSRIRYAAYYHLWKTICLNDRPETFGKAKRRVDTSDRVAISVFEEFRKNEDGRSIAGDAIRRLIKEARAEYILFSYGTLGTVSVEEIKSIMEEEGKLLQVLEIDYKKHIMAELRKTDEWCRNESVPYFEVLFFMRK